MPRRYFKKRTYTTRGSRAAYARTRRVTRRRSAFSRGRRPVFRRRGALNLAYVKRSSLVRMRYVQYFELNAGTISITSYSFRANSIHDPDYTGAGHYPIGHDQMADKYRYYKVLGSKAKFTNLTTTEAGGNPGVWGTKVENNDSVPNYTSVSNALEVNKPGTWRVGGDMRYNRRSTITRKWSLKKAAGRSGPQDDTWTAQFGTNPEQMGYFNVWAGNINGNDPNTMTFLAEIEYIVLCTSPLVNITDS